MGKTKENQIKEKKQKFKPEDRNGGFPTGTPYLKRRFFEILPGFCRVPSSAPGRTS